MKAKQLYANFPVVDLKKLYDGEAYWYTLYMRKKIPKFRVIPITVDKIRVHGVPLSTATMRVLASLYKKSVAFDFIPVDIKANALYQQPFLSLNPFGQTPTLEDGDLKLFGSRAITEYIAEEYSEIGNTLLYPASKKVKAITKVWLDVEGQQFDPVAAKLVFERVFKVMFGMTADPAAVQDLESKLTKVLDIYEDRLWKSEFLAFDCFSLADLHHHPAIHYLMGTGSRQLFESRPKVRAWVEKITVRPAWAMVVDIPEQ